MKEWVSAKWIQWVRPQHIFHLFWDHAATQTETSRVLEQAVVHAECTCTHIKTQLVRGGYAEGNRNTHSASDLGKVCVHMVRFDNFQLLWSCAHKHKSDFSSQLAINGHRFAINQLFTYKYIWLSHKSLEKNGKEEAKFHSTWDQKACCWGQVIDI